MSTATLARPTAEVPPQDFPPKPKPKRGSWYWPKPGWIVQPRRYLRVQRYLHGYTLKTLSTASGITRARLTQLERGYAPFRPREIRALSSLLGIAKEVMK